MSESASQTSAAGVFHGTPLKNASAVAWSAASASRPELHPPPQSCRFPPSLFVPASAAAATGPTATPGTADACLRETAIPRLKDPSTTLLRDVTNDVARVAAAERALRRLQHENDRLKSGEVASHREQAAMRDIIATLQSELTSMEGLVADQMVTLKAVSSEMVRLDPYHLVKSRRTESPANATDEQTTAVDELKKSVARLQEEKSEAARREAALTATNALLEAEVARLTSSLSATDAAAATPAEDDSAVDDDRRRHHHKHQQQQQHLTHDELLRGFGALEAFACQWCQHQQFPRDRGAGLANLFHIKLRFLSCVDASVLAQEWCDRLERVAGFVADGVSLSSVQVRARDPLDRVLFAVAVRRTENVGEEEEEGQEEAVHFELTDDAAKCANGCGEFCCPANSRWPVTFDVLAATGDDASDAVLLATASLPMAALIAASKPRKMAKRASTSATTRLGHSHTICLPLQLAHDATVTAGTAAAAPLSIERECGTLCVEATVTPFADLWTLGESSRKVSVETGADKQTRCSQPSPLVSERPSVMPTETAEPKSPPPPPSVQSETEHTEEEPEEKVDVVPVDVNTVESAPAGEVEQTDAPIVSPQQQPQQPPQVPPVPAAVVPAPPAVTPTKDAGPPAPGTTSWTPPPPPQVPAPVPASPQSAANSSVETEHADVPGGCATVAVYVKAARDLLECAVDDDGAVIPCHPRVQVWVGEQLSLTTPLVYQGRSPSWTPEQGRVFVTASQSTPLRFDVQDVQGTEADFIGSAFLWMSDVLADWPCERTFPVLLEGKRCGTLTVSFSHP